MSLSQQLCSARALTSSTRVTGGFLHSPAQPGAPPLSSGPLPSPLPQHRPLICRTIPFGRAAARTDHRQATAVFPRGDAKLSTENPTRATRSVSHSFSACLLQSLYPLPLSLGRQISHSHVFTPPSPLSRFCAQGRFRTIVFLTVPALWHRSRVTV